VSCLVSRTPQDRTSRAVDAREVAVRVLTRVLRDRAFASASLDAELQKHAQLQARDKALATELVYGSLRSFRPLLKELARFAKKGLPEDDIAFIAPLVIAAYQVVLLDRVPPFAAVNAAVEQISKRRGKPMAGLANALLRKLERGTLTREAANWGNVPHWLAGELERSVGIEHAHALVGAHPEFLELASLGLRLKQGESPDGELQDAVPSPLLANAYRWRHGDPRNLAAYRAGKLAVQEEGAQLLAVSLGAKAGDRVWDACAGRGQKTTLLAERLDPADLWASDLYPAKLEALGRELERLGMPPIQTRALDLTVGTGDVPGDFDRVLVDAPCTGTGTLRRRPEILLSIEPGDPKRLAALAAQIVRTATTRVRIGGRLVFSVCSVLEAECEAVVQSLRDILAPIPFDALEIIQLFGAEATSFRLLPSVHGTDGYFAASLSRVK